MFKSIIMSMMIVLALISNTFSSEVSDRIHLGGTLEGKQIYLYVSYEFQIDETNIPETFYKQMVRRIIEDELGVRGRKFESAKGLFVKVQEHLENQNIHNFNIIALGFDN